MGLQSFVQSFMALSTGTRLLYILVGVVVWLIIVRLMSGGGKSKEEIEKEMKKSNAKVKVKIQWCGG